ncbi:MAG: LysR family transcriptional regulator [Verrucomicrobiales bacterium]|nr:LysR family transcriptional regulator [Verrucomicrobiales bacterium]
MNLHHLELFYYVAKHRGVTAAARHIPYGIQQPAISAQVLQLETALNVTLFQRRPFQLTPEGEALFAFVEPFFSGLPDLQDRLCHRGLDLLRIAAPELVQREYLPTILARVRLWRKDMRFTLREARQEQIEQGLEEQEIDVGLAVKVAPVRRTLSFTPLTPLRLCLLVPERLAIRDATELLESGERISIPLITLAGRDSLRTLFLAELERRQVAWLPTSELASLDLVGRYAAQGFGIGLSLEMPGVKPPRRVRLLPLEDFPMISFGLFHPAKPGPTVQRFIDETLRLDAELRAPAAGR